MASPKRRNTFSAATSRITRLAWCEVEMRKSVTEMGLGDDVAAALAKIKTFHVAPGAQPALVAREAERAIAFIEERSLLTIPPLCEETW